MNESYFEEDFWTGLAHWRSIAGKGFALGGVVDGFRPAWIPPLPVLPSRSTNLSMRSWELRSRGQELQVIRPC